MKLNANKKGPVCQFHGFHKPPIGRQAAESESGSAKSIPVSVIEFIAVAVTFIYQLFTIAAGHRRTLGDKTGISSQAILPGLMTKDEAEAFTQMSRYPRVIENYQDWLDEHENGDEYVSGDTTMSYGQVKKRVRQLTAELEELKDEYGGRQKELRQKVRKIFELGMKAYRKGEGAGDEGKKDPKKKAKQKPSAHPHGKKPIAGKGGKKKNWGEVDGNDAFVRMIASQSEGE